MSEVPDQGCVKTEDLDENEEEWLREARVELLVEEIMGRVLEAERGRAATVIQQKWLEVIYRPGSSSCILRGVREDFATLRDS